MLLKKQIRNSNALWIAALAIFFTVNTAPAAYAAKRVALVVGNAKYEHANRLSNPANDAKAMAEALTRLDFDVTLAYDLKNIQFQEQLLIFSDKVLGAEIALVYYAGHGLEFNGENYLIPIDAKLKSDNHVKFECLSLDAVLSAVEGAKVLKLMLLDACRDNPFLRSIKMTKGTRSIGRGLAVLEPPQSSTLISYAAAAGTVAEDGSGEHSPYTEGLLKYLEQPGLEINLLFREVAGYVQKHTNGRQVPFEYGRLPSKGIFLKVATNEQKPSTVVAADPCRDASAHWAEVKAGESKALYEEHLRLFGKCAFAAVARQKIEEFKVKGQKAPETECDRLAASPNDSLRISSVKGIAFDQINLPTAEIACKIAVEIYPEEARLQYQYGRILAGIKNYEQALKWFRKAADRGHADAMNNIEKMYEDDQRILQDEEALKLFQKAADRGDAAAMNNIGLLHKNSQGVSRNYGKALKWFRKAADLGHAAAMNNIGLMYENAQGVEQNNDEALRWFQKAADLGHAAAMNNIGQLYKNGQGVSKDYREALKWFQKAADRDDALAMCNIAKLYDKGDGVKKDTEEAARWMEAALRAGCRTSRLQMRINTVAWSQKFRIELQKRLNQAGVYDGSYNGTFMNNPETQNAIDAIFATRTVEMR